MIKVLDWIAERALEVLLFLYVTAYIIRYALGY